MACDLVKLATSGVAGLHPYQQGKPVEELERELGIKNIVKLASNENPLGPGEKAKQAISLFSELSRYPDGNGDDLKKALSKLHGVSPDQITVVIEPHRPGIGEPEVDCKHFSQRTIQRLAFDDQPNFGIDL